MSRAVAEEPPERSAEGEAGLLQPRRREREPHGVEVGLRDHGEPKRIRHSLPVRLAVGSEREHRLEQRLELERRPHFADEADRLLACVPEAVRGAGLDGGDLAGPEQELLAAGLQAERSRGDGEALALERMDMRRRDEPVRLDDGLEHDRLAVGVLGGGEERDALAGDFTVVSLT